MSDLIQKELLHDGKVVRLTLNAPKANVLDGAMMTALQSELDDLKNKPEVKLIQFTGRGDHFCFGASVPDHVREKAPAMLEQFHGLFYTIIDLAIPTAAIVSGQCLGGGMELALICNFIFVDKSARFGQPEISLAVFAPPASLILPLKIGQSRADDFLLTGKSITGEEAVKIGIANELFDNNETMIDGIDQWVQKQILPKSASSLKQAVKAARFSFNQNVKDGLIKLERMYLDDLMSTHDANEGIASFIERRKPVWENE